MKLRSGKVLFPTDIEKKLDDTIKDLKNLLIDNQEFAKELVKFIILSPNIEARFEMSDMIRRNISELDKVMPLLGASGTLLILVTGYDSLYEDNNITYDGFYNDGIHTKIQNEILNAFDISLTGIVNQIDIEEV